MNLSDIAAQLEEDLKWRQDELRLLGNHIQLLTVDSERHTCRKAQLVMLYAHYEGYCKFAFDVYVSALNAEGLTCGDVNYHLAASCLTKLFTGLVDADRPVDQLPSTQHLDSVVRRLARQVDLLKSLDAVWRTRVDIPADKVIDTESNLSSQVLKKILHRLGFNHDTFNQHDSDIGTLLNIRNEVAHGFKRGGINEAMYGKLETAVYGIMSDVKSFVWTSLKDSAYKRPTATATP
jgi:hypothetical protein